VRTTVDTSSAGFVVATVIVVVMMAALYVAPTIVAVLYRSPNLVAVILVDLLLGWTVVGWIVAWVLCFHSGSGRAADPLAWPAGHPYGGGLSPDGMFWWDGIAWRDTRVVAPPSAPRSPDGYWWWDGMRWRPVPPPPPQA
jgi:hypothetical protein